MQQISIILPDIRSVINVGSIFRTADAAGVNHIYLTGYTPGPLDRFERPRKDFRKSALGAEESVDWSRVENTIELISDLQKKGVLVVAIEQHSDSVNYKDVPADRSIAFVFGNEVDGVEDSVLAACDMVAEIPMHGTKESLNVAVSVGVVLYR
jgi:tRNA G18 (ribose-2'-O)-methylase SpoU